MQFEFKYRLNGEEETLIKSFKSLSEAIENFWNIPFIAEKKKTDEKLVIISIRKV